MTGETASKLELSGEKIVALIIAGVIGWGTFKDDLAGDKSDQRVAITKLTLQVETLTNAVNDLRRFSQAPRFTEDDYRQIHSTFEKELQDAVRLLENRGDWMSAQDLTNQSVRNEMDILKNQVLNHDHN